MTKGKGVEHEGAVSLEAPHWARHKVGAQIYLLNNRPVGPSQGGLFDVHNFPTVNEFAFDWAEPDNLEVRAYVGDYASEGTRRYTCPCSKITGSC